jgi:RiboL-PSP-HEPN
MSFSVVKGSARTRFTDVRMHLEFIESLESASAPDQHSNQIKLLRGLYYVHLYAALEKTINDTVEQALLLIKNDGIKNRHYKTSFNVVSLYPKMQGFKAAGYKDFFRKSIDIFAALDSDNPMEISNTLFSTNLQNIWFETLTQTLQCFGIAEFQVEPNVRTTVNEVVDKRNAIAHGRESPVVVGERYRSDVLRQRTQVIQLVADQFIDILDTYISQREYIKQHYRASYGTT